MTQRASGSANVGLFTRDTAFDKTFLIQNQMLPTTAIMRRASDFFIFEDGGNTDIASVSETIDGVLSLGAGGGPSIVDEPLPAFVIPSLSMPQVRLLDTPSQVSAPEIELIIPAEKDNIVAVYRIDYDERNDDGQVDPDELPSFEEIRRKAEKGELRKPVAGDGETEDPTRGLDDKGDEIKGSKGGSPTQEDIENTKAEMLKNPQKPSGAYAIIESVNDGRKIVRDVFAIRDWPVESGESGATEKALIEGIKPETTDKPDTGDGDDGSSQPTPVPVPDAGENDVEAIPATSEQTQLIPDGSSRFSSSSLIAGSLWILQQGMNGSKPVQSNREKTDEDENRLPGSDDQHKFGRRARRHRRLSKSLSRK
jgi:hypothetical protein